MKKENLNKIFFQSLGKSSFRNTDYLSVPFKFELENLMPRKCLLYIWQITDPPGGRSIDENKIQIILPGQKRNKRANFAHDKEYFSLLAGYRSDIEIFCLWDAYLYEDIPFSRNVQVKEETLFGAISGDIQTQQRKLRVGMEVVLAANKDRLFDAVNMRYQMFLGVL